jgi:hypothetical protein
VNPNIEDAKYCISTSGEDVKAAWPTNLPRAGTEPHNPQVASDGTGPFVRLSGTSMATTIAAATAALALELTRQSSMADLEVPSEQKLADLHTQSGMYWVFKNIWMMDDKKNRWRYITPWSLIKANHSEGGEDDVAAANECLKDLSRRLRRGARVVREPWTMAHAMEK